MRFQVRRRLNGWRLLGAELKVLRWLRSGVKLEWVERPPGRFHQGESLKTEDLSPDERHFLAKEIPRCLTSGAWKETTDDRFVSNAFLVPKAGRGISWWWTSDT